MFSASSLSRRRVSRSEHPLAQLYCHSTMEHHHFDQCLMVLNSPVSGGAGAGPGRGGAGLGRAIVSSGSGFLPSTVICECAFGKAEPGGPHSLTALDNQLAPVLPPTGSLGTRHH